MSDVIDIDALVEALVARLAPLLEGKREYKYQVSDKNRDAIFLVRDDNLQQSLEEFLVFRDLIGSSLPSPPTADQVRAQQVVRNNPGTSEVEVCQHGDRVFKSGNGKNGKGWEAWDCPKRICDRKWVND